MASAWPREVALDVAAYAVLVAAAGGVLWVLWMAGAVLLEFVDNFVIELRRARVERERARHAAELAAAPPCARPCRRGSSRGECELPSGHDGSHFGRGRWWGP